MIDLRARLAQRLDRLENDLAFVVSLHLFVENLVNALIAKKSPTPRAILEDHRSFSYSVKLTLVFNMGLVPEPLFQNLRVLNRLRNEFAHEIDAQLTAFFEREHNQIAQRSGAVVADAKQRALQMRSELEAGFRLLDTLRNVTFDWLYDKCAALGAVA